MSRVLVIDDDAGTLFAFKTILRTAGHEVTTAALGEDGILAARREQFDVVLCDQRLPDIPGIDVVRHIGYHHPDTAVVLVTGWGTPELVAEAKRAGATNYAEKPLDGSQLLSLVDDSLRLRASTAVRDSGPVGYAARRWADLIVRAVYLTGDLKTVPQWCQRIAVAQGTLKKRCQAVGVTPKDSLGLLRFVRLALYHADTPWDLQGRLDIVDDRTASALLERAGFSDCPTVPPLERLLSRQQLIARSELVEALRERLLRTPPW